MVINRIGNGILMGNAKSLVFQFYNVIATKES
jgi:hypothetical protein